MTEEILKVVIPALVVLIVFANYAWKKWYAPRFFDGPFDAEVIGVEIRTARDIERDKGTGAQSYRVKISYEYEGSTITIQARVKDRGGARLPEEIIEAAGGTLNLAKVKDRFQEAAELRRKMLADGHTDKEAKQAILDLTMSRINAVEEKTEESGLPQGWKSVSRTTTIPILVSKKNSQKIELYHYGLPKMRN